MSKLASTHRMPSSPVPSKVVPRDRKTVHAHAIKQSQQPVDHEMMDDVVFHFSPREWINGLIECFRPKSSNDSVSFLASLCTHVAILLILAFISMSSSGDPRSLILSLTDGDQKIDFASLDFISSSGDDRSADEPDAKLASMEPVADAVLQLQSDSAEASISPTTVSQSRESLRNALSIKELTSIATKPEAIQRTGASKLFAGSSLDGRSTGNRRRLALQNGGNQASEDAVEEALRWFAAHQSSDGSWGMDFRGKPCNGRCDHGTEEAGSPKRIASTGLALLCFLGAGYTHKKGIYQIEIEKGIQFLTRSMTREGRMVHDDPRYEMYEHGIAMLSLSEACEMTGDTALLPTVRSGIDYLIRCQCPDGSWGYTPKITGDLSIVGWQIMALKSASRIGVKVAPEVVEKVDRFVDSQQSEYGAYYGYRSTQRDPCMTAIGLLLRMYRGWPRSDPRILKGADYIADLGPSTNGIYYNYYATQLLFHLKHVDWPTWNRMNRDHWVNTQSKEGHSKGSWYVGQSHFNQIGGRLYCTAMITLSLEVYYRFMPIYEEIDQDFAL